MKKFIVALLLLVSCQLSAQTIKLGELTLTHTRNTEKGFAIISDIAIPYSRTAWTTSKSITFTNWYVKGNIELREIYNQACSQCHPDIIYYYDGKTVVRIWKRDLETNLFIEVLELQEQSLLMAGKKP
jgi:hypothetical protein